jgi:iron complex outermembrane receptor protein
MKRPASVVQSLLIGLWAGCLIAMAAHVAPAAPSEVPPDSALSDELQLIREEDSVIIDPPREQPVSQPPSEVIVITDEEIRRSGAPDLPALLRHILGMDVAQTSGADANVSERRVPRTEPARFFVIVDGRSIYDDAQRPVNWTVLPVTLPEIKRIEVLKGLAAAAWGVHAFDGVINIITKAPEER